MNLNPVVKSMAKGVMRLTGMDSKKLLVPYYWLPYHLHKSGKAWHPLYVTLELTYLCNLRCQMCSLVVGEMVTRKGQMKNSELLEQDGSLRKEVTTEEYLSLIDQMSRAGVKIVKMTGGEPLLRRDIFQLAERVKQHGMYLTMISNGSAKPEAYRDLIRLGLDAITISVDGTREVHDYVRGMRGSFDKAITAIQTITEEKRAKGLQRPTLEVSCAISALNHEDVENVAGFFQDFDIDWLNFGYLHFSSSDRQKATEAQMSEGMVMHLKNSQLPSEVLAVDTGALARRVAKLKAAKESLKVPVKFTPDLSSEEIGLQYGDDTTFTFADKCFYAWYATRIDPWGQMYPCWLDVRLGDVRERPFLEVWNGQRYRSFRQMIRKKKLLPKCATCCILNDKLWSRLPTLRN